MVIQCPVCSTKFSIDSTELAERRDPQFHCSRCDCLFDLKGKSKSSGIQIRKNLSSSLETSTITGADATGLFQEITIDKEEFGNQISIFQGESLESSDLDYPDKNDSQKESLEETQLTFFDGATENLPILKSRNSFLNFEDDSSAYPEELALISAEWPDARADRDLEIDLSEVAKRSMPFASTTIKMEPAKTEPASQAITLPNRKSLINSELINSVAPRLAIPPKQEWQHVPEEFSLDSEIRAESQTDLTKTIKMVRDEDIQKIFDELERSERPAEVENTKLKERYQDTIPSFLTKDQGEILNFPNRDKIKVVPTETAKKRFNLNKIEIPSALIGALSFKPSFISGAALRKLSLFLIGPAISTLAIYAASVSPLTNLIPGSTNGFKAPPSGLEILSLKSEVKLLADGSQFLEVTGSIFNNTPQTYSQVELIARSFDNQNQKSSEILVNVNNGLQHLENAESLKADMLLRLQNEQGIARPIKPNEKVDLRLALPIGNEIPAYFDAEIFGVKRS